MNLWQTTSGRGDKISGYNFPNNVKYIYPVLTDKLNPFEVAAHQLPKVGNAAVSILVPLLQ